MSLQKFGWLRTITFWKVKLLFSLRKAGRRNERVFISKSSTFKVYKQKMASTTAASQTSARNILRLSTEEKRRFLDSFDNVFSDIDGVVWHLVQEIERAPEGFNALKRAGKNLTFITNNSVRTTQSLLHKFKAVNMDVEASQVVHPATTTVDYLKSINFEGLIYVIAAENFKSILREAGFTLKDGPTEIIEESIGSFSNVIFDKDPVRAVIIDFDFNLSSAKLIKANLYLQHPDCLLISGITDLMLPLKKDVAILGPGPFAKVLAESSKKPIITLGKPGKEMADLLIKRFHIKDTKRSLMIGDTLEQDVGFGRQCGFQTLVVLSGSCTREELDAETNSNLIPDYYAESMGDFLDFMADLNKSNF